VSGLFAKRPRDFWPVGWFRKHNTAASDKAHRRGAWPIFVPEVPKRVPADACAHVTRRPDEAKSCTRGKRSMARDFVAQHEAEAFPNARHGLPQVQGVGIVWLGGLDAGALQITEPRIIRGDEGQVDLDVLLPRGLVTACGDALTGGVVGNLFADRRQGILAIGLVDVRSAFSALAHQVHPASEQIARGPHGGRIDIGLREHTTPEPHGNLVRIDRVVCGVAAVNRPPGEGMTQPTGKTFVHAEIGAPIPGAQTLDGDHQTLPIGGDGLAKGFRRCFHMAVHQHCSIVAHETAIQGAGVQVETTVTLVLGGGEAPEVSSSFVRGVSQG
jgi:hypothetical protein